MSEANDLMEDGGRCSRPFPRAPYGRVSIFPVGCGTSGARGATGNSGKAHEPEGARGIDLGSGATDLMYLERVMMSIGNWTFSAWMFFPEGRGFWPPGVFSGGFRRRSRRNSREKKRARVNAGAARRAEP